MAKIDRFDSPREHYIQTDITYYPSRGCSIKCNGPLRIR